MWQKKLLKNILSIPNGPLSSPIHCAPHTLSSPALHLPPPQLLTPQQLRPFYLTLLRPLIPKSRNFQIWSYGGGGGEGRAN